LFLTQITLINTTSRDYLTNFDFQLDE
jgi:hypothetical protein